MARVQQSNSFREEVVSEPGGLAPDTPQPPAWGEGLKESMCGMSGILHDAEGPPPTSCCVEVCDGGKPAPYGPLCSPHHPLQSPLLSSSAAAVPHSDTGAEDTLHRAVIEAPQDWASKSSSPQLPEEVKTLVGLPNQPGSVGAPGEILGYIHTQVPEARDHFHSYSSDVQGRKRAPVPSEVHHHLLGLLYIDAEVVTSAPLHQMFHLLSVFRLIIVNDASHYCCVVRKLHYMAAGVSRRAVIRQQSEQEGAQHTALWWASAEGDGGGDGIVDPDSLRSISQEVQDPVPQCGTQTKGGELLHQDLWDDGIEGRWEVQEEQTNIGVSALQVGEGCMNHWWDGIIRGAIFLVGILVGVHSDVDGIFNVGHDQPLEALHDYRSQSYRSIVIQACHCGALWDRDIYIYIYIYI